MGNKELIGVFMGYINNGDDEYLIHPDTNYDHSMNDPQWFLYETSWNWLMPVVEKIEKLGYGVTIGMGMYCVIQDDVTTDDIEFTGMEESKILSTHKAVVEFINWYNKQDN